jgi:hypothetical protein
MSSWAILPFARAMRRHSRGFANVAERVISSYRASSVQQTSGAVWSMIFDQQNDVHQALIEGDKKRVASILANPGGTNLFYGVDDLCKKFLDVTPLDAALAEKDANLIRTELERLAQAVGAGLVWNPQGGSRFPYKDRPAPTSDDQLFAFLDAALGATVRFAAPFAGERGLRTSRGLISYRAVQAVYQAWLLRNLSTLTFSQRILEIGAGMGRTAYHARCAGLHDYTIVDLPMGNVAQAAFLTMALGADSVWMISDKETLQPGRIKLCPTSWIYGCAERFGVVLNVDSLTEMTKDEAMRYGRFVARSAEIFVSINHEANDFLVSQIVPKERIRTVLRTPYAMRDGYVQEIYFLDSFATVTR